MIAIIARAGGIASLAHPGLLKRDDLIPALVAAARVNRIAPVSREMILNFVAQNTLGLPKSY